MKSYAFLLAGLMALGAAMGHAVVGHRAVLSTLPPGDVRYAVFLFLHQTTWFLVLSSAVFFWGALRPQRVIRVALFIGAVFGGNVIVSIAASLVLNPTALSELSAQFLFAAVYLSVTAVLPSTL